MAEQDVVAAEDLDRVADLLGVDMPVERMTGRPVARRARSSSSSVREAEATLWAGTSNFSRKATASVSHGEANQSMPRFLQ